MAVASNLFPDLTYRILGSAVKVHRALGPGLLEKTYRKCLEHQLKADGMQVACEVPEGRLATGVRRFANSAALQAA